MSTNYRITDSSRPHFLTLTLVEWVDLFTREKYKQILIDSLKFSIQKKGFVLYAYAIMSNHVHLIASVKSVQVDLAGIIRDIKRFTAKEIYKQFKVDKSESRKKWLLSVFELQGELSSGNNKCKIWRHENHPVILDSNKIIDERLNYIHENPVRAGICYRAEYYVYSSAGQYAGMEGILNAELMN